MEGGAHLSAKRERGKGNSVRGAFLRWRRKPGRASVEHTGLLGRARKVAA
jgi:hypothetical protein